MHIYHIVLPEAWAAFDGDLYKHESLAAEGFIHCSFDHQLVRDLAGLHQQITVPVQLVWGEDDRFFPVAKAREMVATFPDARLEIIKGAGLFSHEEKPAEVAKALLNVLR